MTPEEREAAKQSIIDGEVAKAVKRARASLSYDILSDADYEEIGIIVRSAIDRSVALIAAQESGQ